MNKTKITFYDFESTEYGTVRIQFEKEKFLIEWIELEISEFCKLWMEVNAMMTVPYIEANFYKPHVQECLSHFIDNYLNHKFLQLGKSRAEGFFKHHYLCPN